MLGNGSIAQGFEGGGGSFIAPTLIEAAISFEPERLTHYEPGLKSDYLIRHPRAATDLTCTTDRRSALPARTGRGSTVES